jgi:hypothetical protein
MCICVSELTPDTARMWGSGVGDVLHIIEMKSPLSRPGAQRSRTLRRWSRERGGTAIITWLDGVLEVFRLV